MNSLLVKASHEVIYQVKTNFTTFFVVSNMFFITFRALIGSFGHPVPPSSQRPPVRRSPSEGSIHPLTIVRLLCQILARRVARDLTELRRAPPTTSHGLLAVEGLSGEGLQEAGGRGFGVGLVVFSRVP